MLEKLFSQKFQRKSNYLLLISLYLFQSITLGFSTTGTNSQFTINSQSNFRNCIYLTEWSGYNESFPSDIPISCVTNIFYAFAKIDESSFAVSLADPYIALEKIIPFKKENLFNYFQTNEEQIQFYSAGLIGQLSQMREINPNIEISLSIGGAETSKIFRKITKNSNSIQSFVDSIIILMLRYGFDGVDIDWEYPENESDSKGFIKLINYLRSQLDCTEEFLLNSKNLHQKFLLTTALPASIYYLKNYKIKEVINNLSFINLMGYDLRGPWSKKAGFHSNLFNPNLKYGWKPSSKNEESISVSDAVDYIIDNKKIDSQKIILGMPLYGRKFKIKNNLIQYNVNGIPYFDISKLYTGDGFQFSKIENNNDADIIPYKNLPINNSLEIHDCNLSASMCYNNETGSFVTYDTVDSIIEKSNYIISKNLGGGMWWDASGDPFLSNPNKSLPINFFNYVNKDIDAIIEADNNLKADRMTLKYSYCSKLTDFKEASQIIQDYKNKVQQYNQLTNENVESMISQYKDSSCSNSATFKNSGGNNKKLIPSHQLLKYLILWFLCT
ncbi:hypothetical protein B5S32_g5492 [[Candida] boidinii]|nr:hypothetical protein B5S29_g5416 [[Candida] boidinii]OWB81132.1 hypothetical protein B5S32_g5492 [[Candida] boidinii]